MHDLPPPSGPKGPSSHHDRPSHPKRTAKATLKARGHWDLYEVIGLIAAILALATWFVRTTFADEFDEKQRNLGALIALRTNQELVEEIDENQINAARSLLRTEDGVDRLIVFDISGKSDDAMSLIHLMAAMENEQWAQVWAEEANEWNNRLNRLRSVLKSAKIEKGIFDKISHKADAVQVDDVALETLRGNFLGIKRHITGLPSFDANEIYKQPYVPELIEAYNSHGTAVRRLYVETYEAYKGIGSLENQAMASLEASVDEAERSKTFYATLAYILFVIASVLSIGAKVGKLLNGKVDDDGDNLAEV